MSKNNINFYENNLFIFKGHACNCAIDTNNIAPNLPPETTLKIQSNHEHNIVFAFAPTDGLVRLGNKGAIIEKNLLGKLIEIKNGDMDSLIKFFERNGFLFNVSDSSYEAINTNKIFELIKRLRVTVDLISSIGEIKKDYEKIFGLTLYLLLSQPIEFNISTIRKPYKTCLHSFLTKYDQAKTYPQPDYYIQQIYSDECILIEDSLYPPIYKFDMNLYLPVTEGHGDEHYLSGSSCDLYINIALLYAHGINELPSIRQTVELIFHYLNDVGVIKDVKADGSIEYYEKPKLNKITLEMKKRIIDIAKIVIGEEINANMSDVHPFYDSKTMSPSWNIDSLLGGLYFSIFYMKPDLELFRRCRHCGSFFQVRSTSTRKVYCSDECRNRYQQAMHRKRKREKEEN